MSDFSTRTLVVIPVYCKFWFDDGVWNAIAEGFPGAVFAETLEDADKNLKDAIQGHVETLLEIGEFQSLMVSLSRNSSPTNFSIVELIGVPSKIGMHKVLTDPAERLAIVA